LSVAVGGLARNLEAGSQAYVTTDTSVMPGR
jgi:hypothetical protein